MSSQDDREREREMFHAHLNITTVKSDETGFHGNPVPFFQCKIKTASRSGPKVVLNTQESDNTQ